MERRATVSPSGGRSDPGSLGEGAPESVEQPMATAIATATENALKRAEQHAESFRPAAGSRESIIRAVD